MRLKPATSFSCLRSLKRYSTWKKESSRFVSVLHIREGWKARGLKKLERSYVWHLSSPTRAGSDSKPFIFIFAHKWCDIFCGELCWEMCFNMYKVNSIKKIYMKNCGVLNILKEVKMKCLWVRLILYSIWKSTIFRRSFVWKRTECESESDQFSIWNGIF